MIFCSKKNSDSCTRDSTFLMTSLFPAGISFTPKEVGEHVVSVKKNGKHVTNSPFKIMVGQSEIGDASKVKVYGQGLVEGHTFEVAEFIVDTRNAGEDSALIHTIRALKLRSSDSNPRCLCLWQVMEVWVCPSRVPVRWTSTVRTWRTGHVKSPTVPQNQETTSSTSSSPTSMCQVRKIIKFDLRQISLQKENIPLQMV